MESFSRDELVLPYDAWQNLLKDKKPRLAKIERQWLAEWNMHDLLEPTYNDEQRRYIRLGHYHGWFSHLNKTMKS